MLRRKNPCNWLNCYWKSASDMTRHDTKQWWTTRSIILHVPSNYRKTCSKTHLTSFTWGYTVMIACRWDDENVLWIMTSDDVCYRHLPEALSPQTLQATNVFVPVDELDEFESAADDDVVVAFDDDVGENGWLSARKRFKLLISFKSFKNSDLYARTCCEKDNWE